MGYTAGVREGNALFSYSASEGTGMTSLSGNRNAINGCDELESLQAKIETDEIRMHQKKKGIKNGKRAFRSAFFQSQTR